MAVAFDTCNSLNGTGTSITVSLTLGGSANLLIAFVAIDSSSDFNPTATWNGVSMGARVNEIATGRYACWFKLASPDTGTHDLVISSLPSGGEEHAIGISFSGVDTASPTDAAQETSVAAGGAAEQQTNSSAVGDMVVSFIVHDSGVTPTVDSANDDPAMTIPANGAITNAALSSGVSYQAGQASVVSAWASLNGKQTMYSININAGAGGGGSTYKPRRATLLGVG